MQLINPKVSSCCLVVREQRGCRGLRLTHQASLSSIFFSTSPLLCPSAPLPSIGSLIFIHSDLTFQLESSPSPRAGWLEERRRRLEMAESILVRVASKCVFEVCGIQDVRCDQCMTSEADAAKCNTQDKLNQGGQNQKCSVADYSKESEEHLSSKAGE